MNKSFLLPFQTLFCGDVRSTIEVVHGYQNSAEFLSVGRLKHSTKFMKCDEKRGGSTYFFLTNGHLEMKQRNFVWLLLICGSNIFLRLKLYLQVIVNSPWLNLIRVTAHSDIPIVDLKRVCASLKLLCGILYSIK